MSEEHKMTKQDKLVLTITLAAIFFGVFGLGLVGLIFNLDGNHSAKDTNSITGYIAMEFKF